MTAITADQSNAVYGSQDARGRVNRRISKETPGGRVVVGGMYDSLRTACRHEDVAHLSHLAAMSKSEVDTYIREELEQIRHGRLPVYRLEKEIVAKTRPDCQLRHRHNSNAPRMRRNPGI